MTLKDINLNELSALNSHCGRGRRGRQECRPCQLRKGFSIFKFYFDGEKVEYTPVRKLGLAFGPRYMYLVFVFE